MNASTHENEIKLAVANVDDAERLLIQTGFRVTRARVFERNLVFDTPQRDLRSNGKLLRLRQAGDRAVLTFKGPALPAKHKSREEREVDIGDSSEFQVILERLGFQASFVYEKYRTEYSQPDALGVATLDETPIGVYLELEGPPEWVDRTARLLGFEESDYITQSYGTLYLDLCRRESTPPRDMTFAAP